MGVEPCLWRAQSAGTCAARRGRKKGGEGRVDTALSACALGQAERARAARDGAGGHGGAVQAGVGAGGGGGGGEGGARGAGGRWPSKQALLLPPRVRPARHSRNSSLSLSPRAPLHLSRFPRAPHFISLAFPARHTSSLSPRAPQPLHLSLLPRAVARSQGPPGRALTVFRAVLPCPAPHSCFATAHLESGPEPVIVRRLEHGDVVRVTDLRRSRSTKHFRALLLTDEAAGPPGRCALPHIAYRISMQRAAMQRWLRLWLCPCRARLHLTTWSVHLGAWQVLGEPRGAGRHATARDTTSCAARGRCAAAGATAWPLGKAATGDGSRSSARARCTRDRREHGSEGSAPEDWLSGCTHVQSKITIWVILRRYNQQLS